MFLFCERSPAHFSIGLPLVASVVSDSVRPYGLQPARLLWRWDGFSRQEYCSGLPWPPPGDLPDPGIEPRSPALQADSLPSESPGEPNTGVGSHSLLQGIFPTQGLNLGLLHCRQIIYYLSYQGSLLHGKQMENKCKQWQILFSWAPKSLQIVTEAMKLKDACSLKEKL